MKGFGFFLTMCVVLAVAQAVATVLALLLLCALVYGAFAHPRPTFTLLGFGLACSLVEHQPIVSLLVLTAVAGATVWSAARKSTSAC